MPGAIPVTTPDATSTEPSEGKLLLHVPGVVASLSVVVSPTHTDSVPVIVAGSGLTVTTAVAMQVVGKV